MSILTWQIIQRIAGVGADRAPSPLEAEVSTLFDELRQPLLRYTYSLGLPVSDGEDVVQEVFLSLFRHLQLGKPRDNLRGWVFKVARNLTLKRRQRGEPSSEVVEELMLIDPAPNPEESAAMESRNLRLRAVVEALPERDRSCLFLRAEGLRYREIAEALEMSLGAVASSLSRSLGKLTSAYQR